jgi:hypothetical protein
MKSWIVLIMFVVVGAMVGFEIWGYSVWQVYHSRRNPNPPAPPFENFVELTRGVAIVSGGLFGFLMREWLMRHRRRSRISNAQPNC